MSAFLCSDKHFAVVAKALFTNGTAAQQFADALKRENLKSVNHRYHLKTRFHSVNLDSATAADVAQYYGSDIVVLLECIDYQSCEHPDYDRTRIDLALRWLSANGANKTTAKLNLWSI